MHLDHGGNVGKFPKSTFVVQKAEIQNAFWPEPGTGGPVHVGDVMPLRNDANTTTQRLQDGPARGDLDIFGDGSVVVKRWVAHTPGSQMMTVKLKKTGTIILTGDNVYFRENVDKNIPPNIVLAYDPTGFFTRLRMDPRMMATENANFFTAHDPDAVQGDEEDS